LGLPGVPAIDVRNACSGFLYALSIADKFLKTGTCKNALVVGAEIQSTSLDVSSRGRAMSVIFGDGAGAVVLAACNEPGKGILATHLHADGRFAEKLWCELPSAVEHPRIMAELPEREGIYPHMDGPFVFKHAIVRFPEVIQEALDSAGCSVEDLDLVIPHQANLRITEAVAKRMGIPAEKMYSNIQRYGNTTAASIPIAMSEAHREGLIEENSLICMAAFGAGFTWASALVRW